jgi:hypothetical protein
MGSSSREPRSEAITYKTVTPPCSKRHRPAVFTTWPCPTTSRWVAAARSTWRAIREPGLRTRGSWNAGASGALCAGMKSGCTSSCGSSCPIRRTGRRRCSCPRTGRPRSFQTGQRSVSGEKRADRGFCGIRAAGPRSLLTGHRPPTNPPHAAQDPFLYSVRATSTFERSVGAMASQFFSHRSSVFHEYRCLGLWKSLLATYG